MSVLEQLGGLGDDEGPNMMEALMAMSTLAQTLTNIERHLAFQTQALAVLAGFPDVEGKTQPGSVLDLIAETKRTNDMLEQASSKLSPLSILKR